MANRSIMTSLLIGASAIGFAAATPAWAQEAEEAATAGDIIVTARRVEERLQDVPISITVYSQEQISNRNIAIATDLATYTPSLSVNQRFGPEKASYSLRGFNQDISTAPTVGVYFAEVVGVRAQGGTTSGNTVGAGAFTDLENVQVVKGPQGTLFGRNTTGGAILLTPKKPKDRLEGFIEGTYGNFDAMRLQGAINLPLSESFRVRLTADRNKRDGYMRNVDPKGVKDFNDLDYTYFRLSVVADLTPDLENYTVAHYSKSKTHGYAARTIGCANTNSSPDPLITNPATPGFSGTRLLFSLACADQLARQNARGDSLYEVESSNPGTYLDIEQWQVINTTTWKASDAITIKNIFSYGQFRERTNYDLYTSNWAVPNVLGTGGFNLGNIAPALGFFGTVPAGTPFKMIILDVEDGKHNSAQSTLTEELQFQFGSADGRFNAVVGGYLEFSRPIGLNSGRTGIFVDCTQPHDPTTCSNPLFIGNISQAETAFDFDNHGVYAQGTYKITEQLALTVGGRWTFDKIGGYSQSVRLGMRPTLSPAQSAGTGGFIPPGLRGPDGTMRCTDSFRKPDPANRTTGMLVTDPKQCAVVLNNSSNKPTWMINLDYKVSPDVMVYGKYARGYRQGGINFTNPGVELWGPESLDSFEIGTKTAFSGTVSGYFNIAAFYNKLSDQQVFGGLLAIPGTGVTGGAAIINAGKSRSYGLELDGSALFFDSLRIDLGYTYLNTKIQELDVSGIDLTGTPFLRVTPRSVAGQPFNLAPKHKLSMTGTYTLPLDESVGKVSVGATLVHASSHFLDQIAPRSLNGFDLGRVSSTTLVNINVAWDAVGGSPVDLAFFATNVTKEKYSVGHGGGWQSFGIGDALMNPPRMYGVRLRFNFGE